MKKILAIVFILLLSVSAIADIDCDTWYVYTDMNDTITETSDAICDGLRYKKSKADAIYDWVRHHVIYSYPYFLKHWVKGETYYIDPATIIEDGFGICSDQASVAMMLLRAQGIPAAIMLTKNGGHATCIYKIHDTVYQMDFTACTNKVIKDWEDYPVYY